MKCKKQHVIVYYHYIRKNYKGLKIMTVSSAMTTYLTMCCSCNETDSHNFYILIIFINIAIVNNVMFFINFLHFKYILDNLRLLFKNDSFNNHDIEVSITDINISASYYRVKFYLKYLFEYLKRTWIFSTYLKPE